MQHSAEAFWNWKWMMKIFSKIKNESMKAQEWLVAYNNRENGAWNTENLKFCNSVDITDHRK